VNPGVALLDSARRAPGAPAVVEGDRTLTYGALHARTNRLAHALQRRWGLARGERVALLLPNRTEVVELLGACAKAGLVYVGLNFRLAEREYEEILANAEPGLLVCGAEHRELAERLALRAGIPLLDVDGPDWEPLLADGDDALPASVHEVRPSDPFCLVYTSGTTGRPKGVLFDVGAVMQHAAVALLEFELDARSRWLMALPHNSSLQITLLPLLLCGGAVVFADSRGFDAERFADDVARHGATHTYLVPTMLFRLLEAGIAPERIETLRTVGYGAAPIPPERVRELVERYGPRFTQLYGMAEVCSIATMLRKDDHARAVAGQERILASCGRASHLMDVRVVDRDGADVPAGERGEVVFGSPYTMLGYHRDPQRTGEALVDGWMHSGDVGVLDEEGYLFVVGRMKDLVIRGGFNVVPAEVENVLYAHPAVLEAAVFGLPDPEWGEAVVACCALKEGASASPQELVDWCREQGLPSIKVPERIALLEVLPKNAVGKIVKGELAERLGSERAA
jgi:acyl-CoA synthetase (AMP-forming)/AMP-acid ligase II